MSNRTLPVAEQRALIVAEALSWTGTPYHHQGRVKGCGADCATFLVCVYENVGLVEPIEIEHYPPDWHLHRAEERYLDHLSKYCVETESPQPGDIALWKFGRCFSHGAIVVDWPMVIHSTMGKKCGRELATVDWLKYIGENTEDKGKLRPVKFLMPAFWAEG